MSMNLNYATVVEAMTDRLPDQACLVYGDKVTSYREFDDRSARISRALAEHGLGRDSKVGLFLYNCPEYMEGTLAAFKLRAIPINVNYRYVGDELIYLLQDCEAQALIFHSSLGDRVEEIRARLPGLKLLISVDDGGEPVAGAIPYEQILQSLEPAERIERSHEDSLMLYTGGTTGMPKGVQYKVGDTLTPMAQMVPQFLGIKSADSLQGLVENAVERAQCGQAFVSLPASPLMHTAGIMNSGIQSHVLGGVLVILQSRHFDPRELWRAVERHRVNHVVVVGDTFVKPMLQAIDEDRQKGVQYDISSLRIIFSSGVMFSRESKLKLLELGDMLIIDAAGASEGAMAIQVSSRSNPPSETGQFMALPTTEIFDENYEMLPRGCGRVGLIGVGGALPRGYYRDSKKSENTFRTIGGRRFAFTGDMGSIDENGTLTFMGRSSNCINTGGEKVFPEEVEEVIKQHPRVRDCLVVGLPDESFGQRVAAVVSLSAPLASPAEELQSFCSEHLARYKLPRSVMLVEQIQRAPNGKADYSWAKQQLEQGDPG